MEAASTSELELHGVIPHRSTVLIITTMKTSNLNQKSGFYKNTMIIYLL